MSLAGLALTPPRREVLPVSDRLRILVATEDPPEGERLRALLESLGHTVVGTACTVVTAIDWAVGLAPDVLVLALPLPAALEAAGTIMARRPVAILVIGPEDPGALEQAVKAGVMQYLAMPVARKDLNPALVLARARFESFLAMGQKIADLQKDVILHREVARAKGILAQRMGFSEAEAHQKLQRLAQRERCTLAEAATRVIAADRFFRELDEVKSARGKSKS